MQNHNDKNEYFQEMVRNFNLMYSYGSDLAKKVIKESSLVDKDVIDSLLDYYNDYMNLYKTFGDIEYLHIADKTLSKLKSLS